VADTGVDPEQAEKEHAAEMQRRYLIRFEEDTLKHAS
jgi:hypothetical protein